MIQAKTRNRKKIAVRYPAKRKLQRVSVRESSSNYRLDDEAVYNARQQGTLLTNGIRFRLIDTFAGAGGKTLGFSEKFGHAFVPIWANDFDEDCIETYNRNFGHHGICGDIFEVLRDPRTVIPRADVVIGGPPCQGFSNLNQQKNIGVDPRKALWRAFMEVLKSTDTARQ